MSFTKALAAAFCASVLALQAFPIIASLRHRGSYWNYYWPFVNYPMYSTTHKRGDSFSSLELRAVPCRPGVSAVPLSSVDLRIGYGPFERLLKQAAGLGDAPSPTSREHAANQLRGLAATQLLIPACSVQLWRRTYKIGPRGLESPDVPWQVAADWPLTASTSNDSLHTGEPR